MAQFDVYENPNPRSRQWAPLVIDLQHEMLSSLSTRVMAPLLASPPDASAMITRLNPVVTVQGGSYYLSVAEMASVPTSELGDPICSLESHRAELLGAVDLVFTAV